jgi:hypothetical protein
MLNVVVLKAVAPIQLSPSMRRCRQICRRRLLTLGKLTRSTVNFYWNELAYRGLGALAATKMT